MTRFLPLLLAAFVAGIVTTHFGSKLWSGRLATAGASAPSPRVSDASARPPSDLASAAGLLEACRNGKFESLLHAAGRLPDPVERALTTELLLLQWSKADPAAALVHVFAYPSHRYTERDAHLELVLRHYGRRDAAAAFVWVAGHAPALSLRTRLKAAVYQGLAAREPLAALTLAARQETGQSRRDATVAIVDAWARRDVDAALAWLERQPRSALNRELRTHALRTLVQTQPERAGALIASLEPGPLQIELSHQHASHLARTNPRTALDWAIALDDPHARNRSLLATLNAWAEQSPDEALEFAVQLDARALGLPTRDEEDVKDIYLRQIAEQLARNDPAAFALKLTRLPNYFQPIAGRYLTEAWFASDPDAAWTWAEQLPQGSPLKWSAYQSAYAASLQSDPSRAFALASVWEQGEQRYSFIQRAAAHWHAVDPQTVEKEIRSSATLSAREKELILQELGGAR